MIQNTYPILKEILQVLEEIRDELKKIARREKIDFPSYDSQASFSQNISGVIRKLSELVVVSDRGIGGNKRVYKYRFDWSDGRD